MAYIIKTVVSRGNIVDQDDYEGLTEEKALRILHTEAKTAKKHRDNKNRKSVVSLNDLTMTEIRPDGVVITFQIGYPNSLGHY